MKLWWRFREQSSLWARFMMHKYCSKTAPTKVRPSGRHTATWRRIFRASQRIHQHIRWALGDGEINFWEDIWWGDTPISMFCNPGVELPLKRVQDLWTDGEWDGAKLRTLLHPLGVPREIIHKLMEVPIEGGGTDTLRWNLTPHGNFSTASAWDLCRHRHPHTPVFHMIWNDCTTPSMSIFIWRLLANRVPVDTKLQWRKITLASKCRCCKTPGIETREHLFLLGEIAVRVWRYFAGWFPGAPRWNAAVTNLESRIRFWHRRLSRPPKNHISLILPCLVLWFIWSGRNSCIHRETRCTAEIVIKRTKLHLQWLVTAGKMGSAQWRGCDQFEMFHQVPRGISDREQVQIVTWTPPQPPWLKLNTDGMFSPAPVAAGGGGVIRDTFGDLICGFMTPLTADSGIEAELEALKQGLLIAKDFGHSIWIEMDALVVVEMIRTGRHGAANLRHIVTSIRNIVKHLQLRISHTPREGNKIADWLARQGSNTNALTVFDHNAAPAMVKALTRMDQLGLPNFRVRQD